MNAFEITWKYNDETRHHFATIWARDIDDAIRRFDAGLGETIVIVRAV